MTKSPQQKGGLARTAALSVDRRSEIARAAAKARWAKPEDVGKMPEANSAGSLKIGDIEIDCYVLKDRRRLINKRAMARAIGLKSDGGNALMKTLLITTMILLIVLGGSMFAGVFFASGGMLAIQTLLNDLGIPAWGVIALILLLTFVAGFVLDLISVVLIVIPIAMPLVLNLGFDPIWFCIAFLVVLQTSYLTPPMAPSIFYLRAVAPPEITLRHMYSGVIPFIILQIITLVVVLVFPELATWLPDVLLG